jgi:hypothetical protein
MEEDMCDCGLQQSERNVQRYATIPTVREALTLNPNPKPVLFGGLGDLCNLAINPASRLFVGFRTWSVRQFSSMILPCRDPP